MPDVAIVTGTAEVETRRRVAQVTPLDSSPVQLGEAVPESMKRAVRG